MVRDPEYWIYIKQLYQYVDDLARGQMERDYAWWLLKDQVMSRTGWEVIPLNFRRPLKSSSSSGSTVVWCLGSQTRKETVLGDLCNHFVQVFEGFVHLPSHLAIAISIALTCFNVLGYQIRPTWHHLTEVPVKVEPSTVTEFLFVTDPKRYGSDAQVFLDGWEVEKLIIEYDTTIENLYENLKPYIYIYISNVCPHLTKAQDLVVFLLPWECFECVEPVLMRLG